MAAQIIPFPTARTSNVASFDETLSAFRSLADMHDDIVSRIKEQVWADLRPEYHAVLRRAGIVCPGDVRPK